MNSKFTQVLNTPLTKMLYFPVGKYVFFLYEKTIYYSLLFPQISFHTFFLIKIPPSSQMITSSIIHWKKIEAARQLFPHFLISPYINLPAADCTNLFPNDCFPIYPFLPDTQFGLASSYVFREAWSCPFPANESLLLSQPCWAPFPGIKDYFRHEPAIQQRPLEHLEKALYQIFLKRYTGGRTYLFCRMF